MTAAAPVEGQVKQAMGRESAYVESAQDIIDMWNSMKSFRSLFESQWQQIADHLIGRRDFYRKNTPGRARTVHIYDTTCMQAANLLAFGLDSLVTSLATRFVRFAPEDERVLRVEEWAHWFQIVEDILFATLGRRETKFTPHMHEVYRDLVNFNTAGMMMPRTRFGTGFKSIPISELYIAPDQNDDINVVIRHFRWSPIQAVQAFGRGVCKAAEEKLSQNHLFDEVEFLHYVRPRDYVLENPRPRSSFDHAWRSTYVCLDDVSVVSEGGYDSNPYATPRWSIDPGEVYGRGGGSMVAVPIGKMLNQMNYTVIKAAQKATDPALLMEHDSIVGKLKTAPGSVTVARPTVGNREPVREFANGGNFPIGAEIIERERVQARSAYHFELLQIINDPRMTATQVLEVAQTMQRLLSPLTGRLDSELVQPMMERHFENLVALRVIPPAPRQIQGIPVKFQFLSPVQRSQKKQQSAAVANVLTIAQALAQSKPEVLDLINSDESLRLIRQAEDAPATMLLGESRVAEARAERAAMLAEQQQKQDITDAASAVSQLAPLLAAQQQESREAA